MNIEKEALSTDKGFFLLYIYKFSCFKASIIFAFFTLMLA